MTQDYKHDYIFKGLEDNQKVIQIKTDKEYSQIAEIVQVAKIAVDSEKELLSALSNVEWLRVSHKPVNEA